jgi:tRNA 2-thiocytidine biosynthesis protein TtcA
LAYVKEADLIRYAEVKQFPIIPCNLCGTQPNLKRTEMKALLREWEKKFPGRVESLFTAIGNVIPSHLLDHNLYPFDQIRAQGVPDKMGDIAFDQPAIPCAPASAGQVSIAAQAIQVSHKE